MPTYIALANWTAEGIKAIQDSPRRLDLVKKMLERLGGQSRDFYMTVGEYDIVFIYEAPDDAIAARFTLMLARSGFVRTQTMKAFPEAAYREIIKSVP